MVVVKKENEEIQNKGFDYWLATASSIIDYPNAKIPLSTELMYRVCDNDLDKFNVACDQLRKAFEAGQKCGEKKG